MKSIDKFVLVLVASLALLLAGCGGGSSTTEPVDPGPTPEEQRQAEIDAAVAAALAAAEAERQAEADRMAAAERAEEMAATAAKLYAGIAAQNGTPTTTASGSALSAGERAAAYNDANVPSGNTPQTPVDTRIMVGIGTATPVALSEDKMAMVAANHGWEGKKYTAEPEGDGMYEAMVYSNVGAPTPGNKFSEEYSGNFDATTGVLDETTTETTASRVASPRFDQTAGVKEFELPGNNVAVMISGSYSGVSGTYSCVPAADTTCAAQVAASGFSLGTTADTDNSFTAGGGVWTFKPGNPDELLMSTPDAIYASYGWWIHKSADGSTFTASAFVDNKGAVPAAANLGTLQGTATYSGGAAGKYALSSSTGGTNDAGHFTARATLEADFSDNSITGTVDNFMGADGMSRDWSVELKENMIGAGGHINSDGQAATTTGAQTAWTIGGTAAGASGSWSGTLYDNGDDGVPKVGTGTFYTEYSAGGKMVGAFGVNKD